MGVGLLVSTLVLVVICIIGGYFYYNKSTSNSSSTSCPPANQQGCAIGEQCASAEKICASGKCVAGPVNALGAAATHYYPIIYRMTFRICCQTLVQILMSCITFGLVRKTQNPPICLVLVR